MSGETVHEHAHATVRRYVVEGCRCEWCSAAQRVNNRGRKGISVEARRVQQEALQAAYRAGEGVPEWAGRQSAGRHAAACACARCTNATKARKVNAPLMASVRECRADVVVAMHEAGRALDPFAVAAGVVSAWGERILDEAPNARGNGERLSRVAIYARIAEAVGR